MANADLRVWVRSLPCRFGIVFKTQNNCRYERKWLRGQ
jgi:hypothetical protein